MADILVMGRAQHYGEPLPSRQSITRRLAQRGLCCQILQVFSTGSQKKIVFQFKKMNSFISTLLVYMRELSKCSECGRIKSRQVKAFLEDDAHREVDHVLG